MSKRKHSTLSQGCRACVSRLGGPQVPRAWGMQRGCRGKVSLGASRRKDQRSEVEAWAKGDNGLLCGDSGS